MTQDFGTEIEHAIRGCDVVVLRQLTDVQVDAFLAHVPNVSDELRRDAELRAFVRTPLMLTLLCAAVEITVHDRVAHLTAPEARDLIIGNSEVARWALGQLGPMP